MRPQPDVDHRSLIAGVLFTALGVLFLIDQATGVRIDVRWVWPMLLIGLGVAGLASSTARRRRDSHVD